MELSIDALKEKVTSKNIIINNKITKCNNQMEI